MEFTAGTVVEALDSVQDYPSRWEVVKPIRSTRHQSSYLVQNLKSDLTDQFAHLSVCKYDSRLLGNQTYVDNVRRRFLHHARMLTVPLNVLPEPVDLFICSNPQDEFAFVSAKAYSGNEPVLVTELYAGQPLTELLAQEGALDEVRAVRLGVQLCDLIQDLHDNQVLAYELRPQDILVDVNDHDQIWVIGCANYQRLNAKGQVPVADLVVPLTEFSYAAPEVEAGQVALDRRADIYSLGAVVLYMMTKKHVKELRRPANKLELPSQLSRTMSTFLNNCLATDPAQRLQSAEVARRELSEVMESAGSRAPRQGGKSLFQRALKWLLGSE